jgi:hypothetical protein
MILSNAETSGGKYHRANASFCPVVAFTIWKKLPSSKTERHETVPVIVVMS